MPDSQNDENKLPSGNLDEISNKMAATMPGVSDNLPQEKPVEQKRGRGRPKKSIPNTPESNKDTVNVNQQATQSQIGNSAPPQNVGLIFAHTIFSTGIIIGGDEWQPTDIEFSSGVAACDRYLASKNIRQLPPSMELISVFGMYAVSRMTKPKTKQKMSRIKIWLASKFKRGVKNGTLPNNGDNNVGENNPSEKAGAKI